MGRVIRAVLLLLVVGMSTGCASRASRSSLWAPPGETYPDDPFRLEVKISRSEVAVGESLTMHYILTNTTAHAVAACADGWGDFHVLGTRRDKGQASISLDAVRPNMVFRVPPHASMVWQAEIVIPDVGTGPASIRGTLRSSCSLWSGTVVSEPVRVTIRSDSR